MFKNKKTLKDTELRNKKMNKLINERIAEIQPGEIIVFTDGSFSSKECIGSYGIIFLIKNKNLNIEKYVESKIFTKDKHFHKDILQLHNVGTECEAVKDATKIAIEKGYKKITIFHDYEGVSKWYNFEWTAHKNYTTNYVDIMWEYTKYIDIEFIKVNSHEDILYNEQADALAKIALNKGINIQKKKKNFKN